MELLFVVKNKNNKNQSKLSIVTLESLVQKDHIARYVVKFIDESYDLLQIGEKNKKSKKGGRPAFSQKEMFKLLIYAKIEHIESAKYIADMARYHDIYKYVCNDIKPSERSIQRFRRENGKNFEALLKMTLKKPQMPDSRNLITLPSTEQSKKPTIPTTTS